MIYYKVVLSGDNIFFENASALTESAEPIVGFISCKLIEAASQELAVAMAKRDLLVHWNHSFNADRKLGMPKLHLEHIAPVNRWFKPRIHNDYYWFTDADHKQYQLSQFTGEPRRWFWQRG